MTRVPPKATRTVLAAACSAVLSASCWQPAFDPAISASTLTASKMKLVSTIIVTDMNEYRSAPGIFLPRRVAEPRDGIWLHGSSLAPFEFESTSPWYVKTAFSYELFNIWSQGFSAAPQGGPIARMSPAIDASTPLEALVVATKPPSWGAAWLYETITPSHSIALSNDSPILPGSAILLGAGFAADTQTSDSMLMVYYDDTTQAWWAGELSLPLSLPPPVLFATQPITMPIGFPAPTGLSIGFAARKGTSWYVSLTEENGAIRTYRWTNNLSTSPVELTAIKAPLVAVLNAAPGGTPTLLSSNGMSMTAYDEDGTELYSFPVGSLRFVHERWDDVELAWMAVFCRTIFIRDQNDDNGTLRTEVFEIPVSNLSSLEP